MISPSDSRTTDRGSLLSSSPLLKRVEVSEFSKILDRVTLDAEQSDQNESYSEIPCPRLEVMLGKLPTAKIFTDSIHGTMEMPAVAVAIIDTPQFARLRHLKQVGSCHYVYPNASHTRFEHSLGVAHLAAKFGYRLQARYPDLVDNKDVVCLRIAGLCHDLGHGPYSHLWEEFVNLARRKKAKSNNACRQPRQSFSSSSCDDIIYYAHESNSLATFDQMLAQKEGLANFLLSDAGIGERDLVFIKELIGGPLGAAANNDTGWPYLGRDENKCFLYEIVANKMTGIDVDKFDYFLRDDYHMKIGRRFDYTRFIMFARVEKICFDRGSTSVRRQLVLRDKELANLKTMVEDRAALHVNGYQHRVTKIVDKMLVNVMIELSDDPEIVEAQKLLQRIARRDLYRVIATVDLMPHDTDLETAKLSKSKSNESLEDDLLEFVNQFDTLRMSDICAVFRQITTGLETDMVYTYGKGTHNLSVIDQVSIGSVLDSVRQRLMFILCTRNQVRDEASRLVELWIQSRFRQ